MIDEPTETQEVEATEPETDDGDLAQEIARRIVALPSNTTSSGVTTEEVVSIVNEVLSLTE